MSFSDEMAAGFVGEVSRAGVSIPPDVSIVGFDDIDWVAYLPVPLTTIHQPKRELGRRAADFVIQRIAGAEIPAETFCNRS
ncbi:substrate-binding domain-containing protein [Paracoccus jeotgali]|uniref:substrate-binding domain-containing protein n=1 Tax=Paracoccus jeotgali TaxID=2065379 RepID=UPI0035E3F926